MSNYACNKHHLQWIGGPYLIKVFRNISLRYILSEGRKLRKTHRICILILINPSWYYFIGKIIFDLQISIDSVHHLQISNCLDYCLTTELCENTSKMPKNRKVSNIGVWPVWRTVSSSWQIMLKLFIWNFRTF